MRSTEKRKPLKFEGTGFRDATRHRSAKGVAVTRRQQRALKSSVHNIQSHAVDRVIGIRLRTRGDR